MAGGFIRANIAGEEPSDIDILGNNKLMLENAALKLAEKRGGRTHKTDNALTVIAPPRKVVQMITRWIYDDPEQLIKEFDFTIVQAVIWWEPNKEWVEGSDDPKGEWRSMCSEHFYPDLAAKRLVYTCPDRHEDAGGSMLRVLKYVKRGYSIQPPSLARVVSRLISALNFKPPGEAAFTYKQWIKRGVDTGEKGQFINESWSSPLILSLLREVDPNLIIDGFDTSDEEI